MSGWGWLLEDHVLDKEPLERMLALENQLSFFEPRTILLAREMLRACVTILAHGYEDPESPLAQGPVLEIIRNVLKSLENVKGETPIGEAVFKRRRRKAAAKRKAE